MQRRREQLESDLNAEREEIRKANERLRQIQEGRTPGSTTPPPTTTPPPSTTPPSGGTSTPSR
jgi:hypothetical protein